MRDYDVVKLLFEKYITSLEEKDERGFVLLFNDNMEAKLSNLGFYSDAKKLYEDLMMKDMNYLRNDICNFVVRVDGNKAVMSAYVMSLTGIDDGIAFFPLQYGGKYIVEFNKNDSWKIVKLKYDLDWFKGNSYFVNHWKLIDYKTFAGHVPTIISELDSPWAQIKCKQELTDEEMIKETLFKYSFGLDNCDFQLHKDSYIDDIRFYNNKKLVYCNSRDILTDFKRLNHKEHTLEHAIKVCNIDVKQDTAILEGLRIEPHRIGSKNINIETKNYSFYSATYVCHFIKKSDKWKMNKIFYTPKIIVKKEKRLSHYVEDMKEEL